MQTSPRETSAPEPRSPSGAALAGDILALCRAAYVGVNRALRTSPEIRKSRVVARGPLDLEDLLLELEPTQGPTRLAELAPRLGVSAAQLRSTANKLQRLGLVEHKTEGVSLTATGRQKLARLQEARTKVLQRVAGDLSTMPKEDAEAFVRILSMVLDRTDDVVATHLGS